MKESRFLHIWLHTLMLCSPYELCGEGYRVATNLNSNVRNRLDPAGTQLSAGVPLVKDHGQDGGATSGAKFSFRRP